MSSLNPLWTEKYRPTTPDELIGNEDGVSQVISYLDNWDESKDPILIHGPPGIGKTTAAKAVSQSLGYEYVETDASDERTGKKVREHLESASNYSGFTPDPIVIVVDEVDNLDRGGARAMNSVLKDASNPLILIANEYYEMSKGLRNKCNDIEFDYPDPGDIYMLLKRIAESEDLEYRESDLQEIASNAKGDVRGAVTDLHTRLVGYDDYDEYLAEVHGIPPKDVFIGEPTEDLQRVNRTLDAFFGEDVDRPWVIRGMHGFDIAVAEYANRHDISYELWLPKHEDEWAEEWHEINQIRLEEAIKNADSVQNIFMYEEDIDWAEYTNWVFNQHDRLYTWVEDGDTPEDRIKDLNPGDTINFENFL